MAAKSDLTDGLKALGEAGLRVGAPWHSLHNLCQTHEGETAYDWVHALCHRIEGDEWNANYWYRRAGKSRAHDGVDAEWQHIFDSLTDNGC